MTYRAISVIRSRRFPWFIVTLYFEGANSCDLIYYAALVLLFPFYSSFFFLHLRPHSYFFAFPFPQRRGARNDFLC